MHFSNDYGYGMLNAYNAVRMAEVWSLFAPAQTSANEHGLEQLRRHRLRHSRQLARCRRSVLLTPAPANRCSSTSS